MAAEQNIRSGAPASTQMRFRGVQVYSQSMPQRTAVCGQVDPFPDDPAIFVPFVSLVIAQDSRDGGAPRYTFEQYVATSTSQASRAYLAIVAYCYDQGGPTPGPYHSIVSMPPLPETIPNPLAGHKPPKPAATPSGSGSRPSRSASVAPAPLPANTLASTSVSMRRNGNLHATPHGPSVRIVPQGTTMRVFSQAPGGWLQVGDTEPRGWVHESLTERRPP